MPQILLLTETELKQSVRLDKGTIDTIENAFAQLDSGEVIMPPVLSMELPMVNGEVDVKTAYIPKLDSFTVKISPGFFNNPQLGLASLNGLMVTFDAKTGLVKAVLLDNGFLTDIRTAAAGGVAARHLAPQRVDTAGIIGAGVQAQLQAQALLLERKVKQLLVWSRTAEKAEHYAQRMQKKLNIPIRVAESREELVKAAQVVITTTPAKKPLIDSAWLHPGLHITAMGADSPEKNELEPAIAGKVDRFVVDRVSQSLERGEMRSAVAAGILSPESRVDELGSICRAAAQGRLSDNEITLCDLTGTGVQDTAIADFAIKAAIQHNLGVQMQA